jgi:hypothetical protein
MTGKGRGRGQKGYSEDLVLSQQPVFSYSSVLSQPVKIDRENDMAQRIIVAVHGIGNQLRYATIQSVISQFCLFRSVPSAIQLGSFYPERKGDDQRPPLKLGPPHPQEKFGDL